MLFQSGILSFCLGLCLFMTAQVGFSDHYDPNDRVRVIIKYKQPIGLVSTAALASHVSKQLNLPVYQVVPMANDAYVLILDISAASRRVDTVSLVLERLRQDPNIYYAVKDRIGYFKPVPDPNTQYTQSITEESPEIVLHDKQWNEFKRPGGVMLESAPGLKDGAWAYTTGASSIPIVVAVLDTGITLNSSITHSLLKEVDNTLFGWNFSANNSDLIDDTKSYHGTHVSGIIAGYGHVMQGVGKDLKILTVKIPDASGMFYESSVVNAIYWSVGAEVPGVPINKFPASVLNMSFGVDNAPGDEVAYCDQALQEAVLYARQKGAILAVAAGNGNHWEHLNAPAVCQGTIKVGATGPDGLRSYYSNYGPSVTYAAPGGDKRYGIFGGILSTVKPGSGYQGSGFDFYQGTSMATPHVAGIAGLIFALAHDVVRSEQVEQILYATTHEFGQSTNDNVSCIGEKSCGHGIIDAENAIKAAMYGYDDFFSAPTVAHLETKTCANGKIQPEAPSLSLGALLWVQIQTGCETAERYQLPHLEETADGTIYASYGSVRYQLKQSKYRECHVVGVDGMGCVMERVR